ncbi:MULTISPECIES: lipoprotein-releasing ABC transporter permease subunit [Gammaproteobacteria]|uniref:lipoprotein-releasing ABC transporter permease subunit n=1 Tax=Gammaproteobacteria TaxID=1236 RepID=UPI001AD9C7A0|nr:MULTISPECIES: lipoprotein-releasing ABC transporter permease subunit [Gammaproteobacteria]MBO9481557.1 lipoprotein-releasing ABC transporter permease subunit [Salinisphaera sp. G21_0]MBO9493943.1 lipoprotein-releasing ABC transporter permease subunit [Thalassotalea sp. G20_0]
MFRPLPFFIGLRYTRAKRRNHFISFISGTSMVGLTLGVSVLIIVLSVMNGFDRELKQRVLGMVPHATITAAGGGIEDWQALVNTIPDKEGIEAAAPFVDAQGMLANGDLVRGTLVYGIDPGYERRVSIIADHMKQGALEDLQPGEFGILLGDILANYLGLAVGDKVTMVLPEASVNLAGVLPRLKRFTVVGTFSVGADVDGNLAYAHREDLARFLRVPEGVTGIRLKMDDLFAAPKLAWDVAITLPGRYYVQDWTRSHGRLFQAIQMEKTMVGLLLTLIVAVAAFNIVSTLVMVVTDKQGDIAILRTFGATPKMIMGIFMVQGSLIGVIGTLLGVALGIAGALNVSEIVGALEKLLGIHFLSPDVYFISYLPSELMWQDVAVISVSGLLMSFLATLYPAWRASRTQPAEALRYE